MTIHRFFSYAIALPVLFIACTAAKQVGDTKVITSEKTPVASPNEDVAKWKFTNIPGTLDFASIDPKVDPRQDFYAFANGTWLRKNPVPSTESSWGSFNELLENNNKVLRQICEKAASEKNEKGSYLQVVGDFYYSAMDSVSREKAGIDPLQLWLNRIDALKDKKDLATLVAEMNYRGTGLFFDLFVDQDLKDNSRMVMYFTQGGLTLPSNDYYLKQDTSSVKLREVFIAHLEKMMGMLGYKPAEAKQAAGMIFKLEETLAKGSKSPVALRDPESNYNKMQWKEFGALSASFNWDAYVKAYDVQTPVDVIVGQPEFFKQIESVIQLSSLTEIKHYLKWHLLHSNSANLTQAIEENNFSFFGTHLRGAKKMKPRWKRVLGAMSNSSIDEALGRAFVDKQFKEEEKRKVNEMVDHIFAVFKDRLDTLEWMSETTRKEALYKLSTFVRKLGFPQKWEDYSSLVIDRNSYAENSMRCSAFATRLEMQKLSKPIDKTTWQMPPHIVNAYYNPIWNEIVFPAGIMQPPFFDISREDAVNYARMGAVIGHELTHGFDDQGCQFDAGGNLKNWWLREDSLRFSERTQKLVDCFNNYEALPGVFVNGSLTLGENIADLGGLRIAYYAYKRSLSGKKKENLNGFTPEQRFFLSFAQIWKVNFTDSFLKVQIFTDPHSPGKYRVLGTLSNLEEFYEAFGVKEGDAMYRSEVARARIW